MKKRKDFEEDDNGRKIEGKRKRANDMDLMTEDVPLMLNGVPSLWRI